ncbi:MurR/RpiR family transcriptional regulator [Bordetella muralis]|uniref:MurR/RpiR family transcriptional regulator n=1 Tax=Bordetella muralis TaxID=1649130 RepID=UPI0039F0668E
MTQSLHDRILGLHDQLTDSERRLAEIMLEHLSQLAAYTGAELAQKAGVSKATAGRFFRRLGYDNFNEIRAVVREQADLGSPLQLLAGANAESPSDDALAQHLAGDLQNLVHTFERIERKTIDEAIQLLGRTRRVFVAGFRNGRVLAQYAWALLTQLRDGVALVPGAGLNLAEDLADLGPDDLLLVMDFRRRVALLRPMVEHANRAGAKVITLTDPTATELPARSDVVLRCTTQGAQIFDSYVAPISLINHLCSSLAATLGATARKRLENIESLHNHYGDLHR